MTHRLLVNPGTPQAWEILLRPGANRIGRSSPTDFLINHPSVSGSHCEIIVSSAGVLIKDLGSTNGTFVDRAPVHEALLQSGQHVQLGVVDMVFESMVPQPATIGAREREAGPESPPAGELLVAAVFCKYHAKTPARYFCHNCQKYFCDMCVATRTTDTGSKKTCRACGVDVAPVQVNISHQGSRGILGKLFARRNNPGKPKSSRSTL